MNIYAKLLDSDASLNRFFEISQIGYVPGENVDIVIRIFDTQKGIRLIPVNLAATITLEFLDKTSPTLISKAATVVDALDRSIWQTSLTQLETTNLSGSNIQITYDVAGDGVTLFKTVLPNVLVRSILSGGC